MNRIIRNLALAAAFFCCLGGLHAQDTIRMSWTEENNPVYIKSFRLQASLGEKFIVDYGNGDKEDTLIGLGEGMYDWIYINHTYTNWQSQYTITITSLTEDCKFYILQCNGCKLTDLSISSLTLAFLYCEDSRLSTLDISKLPALKYLFCNNNYFSLSECYRLRKNYPQCYIGCDWHNLPPQEVEVGEEVDFSSEAEFDGVATVFDVMTINRIRLPANAYLINNGIILFKDTGTYRIEMSNPTMQGSAGPYPINVGVEIHVTSDATLSYLAVSHGKLYPAFDNLTYNYDVTVGYDTTEITINATANDANTIISGDTGLQQLQVGSNVFTVLTTLDTTTKTYTITVNRKSDVGIAEITNYELQITNYEIYNVVGQLLASYKSLPSLKTLPAGIYFIKLQTNNGTITKKLLLSQQSHLSLEINKIIHKFNTTEK